MRYDSRYPWFLADILIFVLINVFLLWIVKPQGSMISSIHPWHLLVLGLAVFRGADIIANETVTKPLRAPFVNIKEKEGKEVEVPKKTGLRGNLGSLLYCPSCMGVWVAMVLIYGYLFNQGVVSVIILILALSGVERFFTSAYNRLKNIHAP